MCHSANSMYYKTQLAVYLVEKSACTVTLRGLRSASGRIGVSRARNRSGVEGAVMVDGAKDRQPASVDANAGCATEGQLVVVNGAVIEFAI